MKRIPIAAGAKRQTQLREPRTQGMRARIDATSSSAWKKVGVHNALALFRAAATRVPAYQAFLKTHHIDPSTIRSWEDFQRVPLTSKDTYLKQYPRADLCWEGSLGQSAVFSSTSGSTGKPFYFQRTANLEEQYAVLIELFLQNGTILPSPQKPTLVIIGFGMGVWIGGMLTYRAFDIASRKGLPVSILPVGVNKAEILKALKELAPSFAQTIVVGYPPFVKDVIDDAQAEGVQLKRLHIRFLFAAEAFSEAFREHLARSVGMKNMYRDTLNIYGTADIGAMAFETPTAILVRRIAMRHPKLFAKLFNEEHKTPTLAQYNPTFVSFEAPQGEIVLTGYSAMPLVRYAVGDRGGVYTFDEIDALCAEHGIDLRKEAQKARVPLYRLPFVYVYERSDLAATLYGLLVYPQYLRDTLLHTDLQRYCTGKFQLETTYDAKHNQCLVVHIELKQGVSKVSAAFTKRVTTLLVKTLTEKSSEYRELSTFVHHRALVEPQFHIRGDLRYFPAGIKQTWVKK